MRNDGRRTKRFSRQLFTPPESADSPGNSPRSPKERSATQDGLDFQEFSRPIASNGGRR